MRKESQTWVGVVQTKGSRALQAVMKDQGLASTSEMEVIDADRVRAIVAEAVRGLGNHLRDEAKLQVFYDTNTALLDGLFRELDLDPDADIFNYRAATEPGPTIDDRVLVFDWHEGDYHLFQVRQKSSATT